MQRDGTREGAASKPAETGAGCRAVIVRVAERPHYDSDTRFREQTHATFELGLAGLPFFKSENRNMVAVRLTEAL